MVSVPARLLGDDGRAIGPGQHGERVEDIASGLPMRCLS
jgi:hypothetical protein